MQPLSNQQRLHLVNNTQQLYSNYMEAHRQARSYAYGMRWKLSNIFFESGIAEGTANFWAAGSIPCV